MRFWTGDNELLHWLLLKPFKRGQPQQAPSMDNERRKSGDTPFFVRVAAIALWFAVFVEVRTRLAAVLSAIAATREPYGYWLANPEEKASLGISVAEKTLQVEIFSEGRNPQAFTADSLESNSSGSSSCSMASNI
jgi:hypothetical protein